ncbi:2OG-Fe(II) oxygenase [Tsuneonella sp. YG55]|uniref:2OG-Fe(II) oxygenase n=1 Tax=Tsuneonella litorea TaxID=2976475 RepID=A0A9X3ALV7_9SPHN|nr:2OG-Fe(II) oxygenase family protein [Tsuneonella litorea]MCT2559668.1 2OG-Fe(II) oxygenase [Tsuneonella litorea]
MGGALDARALGRKFEANRRVHLPAFLHDHAADEVLHFLTASHEWRLVVNAGEKLFELDRGAQAGMSDAQRRQLEEAVYAQARYGFQYCYETIRVPDSVQERAARGTILDDFARFMSQESTLAFFREVLGEPAITFADAQATAYGPGHFLTAHDDAVAGKNRVAAYVFNLSRDWRLDWGGLLAFHGSCGVTAEALVPAFNALNLFAVPQPHSVTMVAPFAPRRRYAITGWFRTGPRPGPGQPG